MERSGIVFGHPLECLRDTLGTHRVTSPTQPLLERYNGGLVGYLSYDLVRYLENLPAPSRPYRGLDFELGLFLDGIIYDHDRERAYYFSHAEDRFHVVQEALADDLPLPSGLRLTPFESDMTEAEFTAGVESIGAHIRSGDIYQAVLSRELSTGYRGDLLACYTTLRRINPSPYMFYLDLGSRVIAGSSPEMLGALHNGLVSTCPIAGTRPLGQNNREQERHHHELLKDEKELAEHAMLVDLARNDIGRVAQYGTVSVPDYKRVKRFSHVQHLVSRVEGRLRQKLDALDVLAALFPAGTVSGAPKLRAIEIITGLEQSPRGPYAGALGYLALNGSMDMAITIRTLWADAERIYLRAGAGIVYDSVPKREWVETEHKLAVMKAALEACSPCVS
jgi:anthranilate synthase component 1